MKAWRFVAPIAAVVGCVGLPVPALSEGYDAADLPLEISENFFMVLIGHILSAEC